MVFIVILPTIQMPEEETFCVLVRLMTTHKLREMYKPSMTDLSICFYQLDKLIEVGPGGGEGGGVREGGRERGGNELFYIYLHVSGVFSSSLYALQGCGTLALQPPQPLGHMCQCGWSSLHTHPNHTHTGFPDLHVCIAMVSDYVCLCARP